jgi:hypothetical protein
VEKCVSCQFYDRRIAGPNEGKSAQWGQCRRTAPLLHPINAKSYMVEGVWPHVRDDDWCGEWKAAPARRTEPAVADIMTTALMPGLTPPHGARMSPLASLPPSSGASPAAAPLLGPALAGLRRGE